MAETLYVVIAASGEYEDFRERNIAVFASRAVAEQYAAWAYEWTARVEAHRRELDIEWHDVDRFKARTGSPYDPAWECGDDARYRVEEVSLLTGPQEQHVYQPKRFRKTKEPA